MFELHEDIIGAEKVQMGILSTGFEKSLHVISTLQTITVVMKG